MKCKLEQSLTGAVVSHISDEQGGSVRKISRYILILISTVIVLAVAIGTAAVWYVLRPVHSGNYTDLVSAEAFDGITLVARERVTNENGHNWVILVHSYRSSKDYMEAFAKGYRERGYNTLSPDNRAHGQSGGKFIGMGYLDGYDILKWVDYITEKDPEARIVLHGVSMGGAAVMMLSGREDLSENIVAIVEDCGYMSAKDYLTWKMAQRFHLPEFPIIPIANVAFKAAAGYYMTDASAIDGVSKSKTPILFIHAADDTTVPVDNVYKLYDAATCEKELYVVSGAGHGESILSDKEAYWEHIFAFLDKFIK